MLSNELPRGICPLPWLHFSANTDTSVRVCCNTDHGGHVRDKTGKIVYLSELSSIGEAFNNDFMKGLRASMLKGERPQFCNKCYRTEANGGISIRQGYLNQFKLALETRLERTEADGMAPMEISYLDLSLGNHCNLKCRMCSPSASHLLQEDFKALKFRFDTFATERANKGWKDEDRLLQLFTEALPSFEEILTTGGEPFLSKFHLRLLEAAVEKGVSRGIILRYHTNLTVLPPRLVKLWEHFKRIEIHGSIEAHSELNDYIRFPSKWPIVIKNLEALIELKNRLPLWLEIHTCFQAYNILMLPELLSSLRQYQNQLPIMPYFIWVDNPAFLSATSLPPPLRQLAMERTLTYIERNLGDYSEPFADFNREKIELLTSHFKGLMAADYSEGQWREFVIYTESLDRLRGQSLQRLVPAMVSYKNRSSDLQASQGLLG